jgi:lactoylglutathione lyase
MGEVLALPMCYAVPCQIQRHLAPERVAQDMPLGILDSRSDLIEKEEASTMFQRVVATVLFVRDLATCQAFYRDMLGLAVHESDAHSAAFKMENVYFLLLDVDAAADLLGEEADVLKLEGGPRGLLAASVANVDAAYEALKASGVAFLRPPTDQTWGLRTAHFADPEGNLWEIHQPIGAQPTGEAAAHAL